MGRKYADDYRLDNVLTPGGKLKTVPIYCGDWFELELSGAAAAAVKRRYLILMITAVVSLLYLLSFTNHMDRSWYVALPAGISTIFLFFTGCAVWRLWTANGPVTREHKDKTHDRLAPMSMFSFVLALLCLAGCIYHLIAVRFGALQLLFTAFSGLYLASTFLMFHGRKALLMKKSDKPKTQIPDI